MKCLLNEETDEDNKLTNNSCSEKSEEFLQLSEDPDDVSENANSNMSSSLHSSPVDVNGSLSIFTLTEHANNNEGHVH